MASKKENQLTYLQMPLPSGRKSYKIVKRSWSGLNYRQTIDTGAMSMERNISTLEAPYLVPSQKHEAILNASDVTASPSVSTKNAPYKYNDTVKPIGLFGFDNFLIVIYRKNTSILLDYIIYDYENDSSTNKTYTIYTGTMSTGATEDDEYPRCVVQFNVYDTPTDPAESGYTKRLLIFPDKKAMDFEITSKKFVIDGMDVLIKEYTNSEPEEGTTDYCPPPSTASHCYYYRNKYNSQIYRWVDDETDSSNSGWKVSAAPDMPPIEYATTHLSRLFGVGNSRVYASGYNDYTNWNLDTVDEYGESNAWVTASQSNVEADGNFTGITSYQGHVVCFKKDFMHEIYNTKNPFRIQDIYAEGTIDHRSIQDVDGRLIFVSEDDVKVYTGSSPRIIGYYLNMPTYEYAVAGTDGRCYYLYCEDYKDGNEDHMRLFVYDTVTEQWSEQSIESKVLNFAHNKNGMYMLCEDGYIYKLDTGNYDQDWSFETDLITNETVDIKHIKKIQMFADIAYGAEMKVYILYDDEEFDEDASHLVYESKSGDRGQKAIRVKPRQTASYGIKLHVEGHGYVRLYEAELVMESGGTLYA